MECGDEGVCEMTPTKQQKDRRDRPFQFTYEGGRSWFCLWEGGASFHQTGKNHGQQDVFGLSINRLIKALKACGYIILLLCLPVVAEAKEVAMPYDDFLQIVAKVEYSEKLKNKAVAENGVLLKLKDEQGTIIKIQAEQIQACESIVKQQEQLGATQDQINQAVEMELRKTKAELEEQKSNRKWWAGGGFGVGVVVGVVIMVVMN